MPALRENKRDEITPETWKNSKFGKLRMKNPGAFTRASGQKVIWVCDCGKEALKSIIDVTRGHVKSCGKCNLMPPEFWEETKFGNLKLSIPQEMALNSNKKLEWKCDCGGVLTAIVQNVTKGRTTCCGKCRNSVDKWFSEHKRQIRSLKPPIAPDDLPPGPFSLVDSVMRTGKPVKAICAACGREYSPRWEHIRTGVGLTCGCSTNRVSKGQQGLADFVKSMGLTATTEHKVNGLSYDIFVLERNMVLEFQGIKWHSMPGSKQRDTAKYKMATKFGLDMIAVYEDEWVHRRRQMEQLIMNRMGKTVPTVLVRASKVKVNTISSASANKFYEEFHYIGPCKAAISYGVLIGDTMVACCSFSRPTRQSSHQWELVRMASNPNFRIYGVWSKLLKQFVNDHTPESIVSFSDNRLFLGGVYAKLGFKHDGNTPPSYYWVKSGKRFNKSGLRKKGDEKLCGKTEVELREEQGYSQIWDVGKKRWVWKPE
jgi:predicted SprT family Zn-dependent metalloprotease